MYQSALQGLLARSGPVGAPPQTPAPQPASSPDPVFPNRTLPAEFHGLGDPSKQPGMLHAPSINMYDRPQKYWTDPTEINMYNAQMAAENPAMLNRPKSQNTGLPGGFIPYNPSHPEVSTVHTAQFTLDAQQAKRFGVPPGSAILVPTIVWNDENDHSKGYSALGQREAFLHAMQTGHHLGIFRDEQSAGAYEPKMHATQVWMWNPSDYAAGQR